MSTPHLEGGEIVALRSAAGVHQGLPDVLTPYETLMRPYATYQGYTYN